MSISSTTSTISYSGNNSTVVAYVIPFKFFNDTDIYVKVVDANGEIAELDLTTDYTLTGAGEASGGEMLTVAAYNNTYTVTIERRPPYTQLKSFREGQASAMEAMETGLDVLVTQIQALAEKAGDLESDKPGFKISSSAPTVNDDITRGYSNGHVWIETTNSVVYFLQDNTNSAAVWFTPSVGDLYSGSLALTFAQQQQLLTNIGLFDATDTGALGAKFEPNPDNGFDLALYDQGTSTYRKIRLNNGAIIVE